MRVGSLCTGYGGLEMGIEQAFGPIELVFVSDIDKNVSKLLAHHHPDTPNLGDLTKVNWEQQQPVDLLCAGYPSDTLANAFKNLLLPTPAAGDSKVFGPNVDWKKRKNHAASVSSVLMNQLSDDGNK